MQGRIDKEGQPAFETTSRSQTSEKARGHKQLIEAPFSKPHKLICQNNGVNLHYMERSN